jgi:hypothetical protein
VFDGYQRVELENPPFSILEFFGLRRARDLKPLASPIRREHFILYFHARLKKRLKKITKRAALFGEPARFVIEIFILNLLKTLLFREFSTWDIINIYPLRSLKKGVKGTVSPCGGTGGSVYLFIEGSPKGTSSYSPN